MTTQPVLIDMTPYLPTEGTIIGAVEEQIATDAAEVEAERAADAERLDVARSYITADLPEGAAERWVAALSVATDAAETEVEPVVEEPAEEPVRAYIPNVVALSGGKVHMGTSHDEPVPYCRKSVDSSRYRTVGQTPVTCKRCAEIASSPLFVRIVPVAEELAPAPAADQAPAEVETVAEVAVERKFAVLNTALGDIRVHAAECGDVARDRARYGNTPEVIRSADKLGVVAEFMSDFVEEGYSPDELDGDFVWLACCGDLPWVAEGDQAEAEAPEVDLDALAMSPSMRAMLLDLNGRTWHYQTRHKAHEKGLVTDVKATRLTALGERVHAALQAS